MSKKTKVVYHPDYLIHSHNQHPERKERLEQILLALRDNNLVAKIELVEPQPVDIEDLALIHDRSYIESVEQACLSGRNFLDMDTYIVPESYRVALLSAGGAVTGLSLAMSHESPSKVFVINRPPGHHAEYNKAMGFCLFNNIAVAAAKAIKDYGVKRVAIVDWDVHHGNGTQHSFEADPQVLFISTHQSPAYPGSGALNETGVGKGKGFTVNIPLPAGCGDREYEICFDEVVVPILNQFKPELLLVSAGQDAYHLDPLAGMALTNAGYYMMAEKLSAVADSWSGGRMLFCLEGGYHLQGQAGAVIQVLNAIGRWGLPKKRPEPTADPVFSFSSRLNEIKKEQNKYWNF